MKNELHDHFLNIPPAELAKLRGKDQRLSTRDKQRLLTKIAEIESILEKRGERIIVKKI